MTSETTNQQRDPQAFQEHFKEGQKAELSNNRAQAAQEYQTAYEADPDNSKVWFHLAYNLDMLGEEQEAISFYEKCAEQDNPSINALINLAVLYEDEGKHIQAERLLRQVLATNPNHKRARLYIKDVAASKQMHIDDKQQNKVEKYNATLDTPVSDFDLTVRTRNGLRKMDIRTLGELTRATESELRSSDNFNDSNMEEIKTMLAQRGLKLGSALNQFQDASYNTDPQSNDQEGKDAILTKHVNELDLSVRARKAVEMLGISNIGELIAKTEEELMGIKNFGMTSLLEIKEKLLQMGLELRKLTPEELAELEEKEEEE